MELPTINVTDAQAQVLLQVFGTATNYRTWLKKALREEVESRVYQAAKTEANAIVKTALDTLKADVPDIYDPVEVPPT